jgi:hypothetical protein
MYLTIANYNLSFCSFAEAIKVIITKAATMLSVILVQ